VKTLREIGYSGYLSFECEISGPWRPQFEAAGTTSWLSWRTWERPDEARGMDPLQPEGICPPVTTTEHVWLGKDADICVVLAQLGFEVWSSI
jgi:hypothetical protein